ncbi:MULTISPECIES: sensor histidine kinase [unclassified Paraflavitalea]|uniref:sensor histidine kinase n=1 Tax=unclassified Paraflavitalea TaxID=2798305 RepID=UPI003D33DC43
MKLKNKIALIFTGSVSVLTLVFCLFIYAQTDTDVHRQFQRRLRNKANTTIQIFQEFFRTNPEILTRIDRSTIVNLPDKTISIFNSNAQLIYHFSDSSRNLFQAERSLYETGTDIDEANADEGERRFILEHFQYEGTKHTVIVSAIDPLGVERLTDIKNALTIGGLLIIAITLLLSRFVASFLTRPIRTFITEMNSIQRFNLKNRISLDNKSKDELSELALTFNDLMDRLEQSFQIQNQFISNASHELCTPLTSISNQLEVTLQKQRATEDYQQVLKSVFEDVKHLNKLTTGLLEMARSSESKIKIEIATLRIDEVLMRVVNEVQSINENQVHLDYLDIPEEEEDLELFGNRDLLESAIKNVVLNACKFDPNKSATVTIGFTKNDIQIDIADKGIGMSKETIKNIFEPFYQGPTAAQKKGFGLGLSIARNIIKFHNGKILVTSEPNSGSVFHISLPKALRTNA